MRPGIKKTRLTVHLCDLLKPQEFWNAFKALKTGKDTFSASCVPNIIGLTLTRLHQGQAFVHAQAPAG